MDAQSDVGGTDRKCVKNERNLAVIVSPSEKKPESGHEGLKREVR